MSEDRLLDVLEEYSVMSLSARAIEEPVLPWRFAVQTVPEDSYTPGSSTGCPALNDAGLPLRDACWRAPGGVTGSPGSCSPFSHGIHPPALIQETLVEELSLTRRVRLHARIAETLEEMYGEAAEAHAAELAHHFRTDVG